MKPSTLALVLGGALASAKQPNILFVLTDDQDLHMNSIEYMPLLQKHIIEQGTTFTKHFCTVAICCPSRANLWTGHAAHNTNGGFQKVISEGWNDNYLPLWMQDAGYNTYYSGKLWNGHTVSNYNETFARGFNGSDFLLDPYTYKYYDAVMTRNGQEPVSYAGNYSTDVIKDKILGFLDEALSHQQPWFVVAAPIAPHATTTTDPGTNSTYFDFAQYAPRHADLFKNYTIPRDTSFNAKVQGGVSWIKNLAPLNTSVIDYNDEFQRSRLRALQAVDEMIEAFVEKLDDAGVLDDTYVIFSTDNGFHISQHRMTPGKECGYDTDIHIPLAIRGPGIAKGQTIDAVTSHTDIAPTILELAGAPKQLDGKVIPLTVEAAQDGVYEHAAIEYWGRALAEGIYLNPAGSRNIYNNTYKGLRLVGDDYSIYYSVWCTNEAEFYDVKTDPGQIHNLASDPTAQSGYRLAGRSLAQVIARLDALMMVLKSCKGVACTQPWAELHPAATSSSASRHVVAPVRTLTDALASEYDDFYAAQPKVAFTSCEMGYLVGAEGPQQFNKYADGGGARRGARMEDSKIDGREIFLYGDDWHLYT
ncbi:arylsulfatase [Diplodia corticola]|uniref:Arylsulfatase n=1 Tax=Diplodia corticola TaxID=236234 RepID=A0A1J9R2L6_9PEZI|nr:arylsulfatase [Diplodia corticola]OJD35646.1 arylsulfatase [Diplodia corticola]